MATSNSTNSGAGFTGLLLIAFIVLKLCSVINWSWWWVLSPFWIPLSIAILGYAALYLIKRSEKNRLKKALGSTKSKWQIRMEEMQKKQKTESN